MKKAVLLIISIALMMSMLTGCVKTLKNSAPKGYPYHQVPLYESGNASVTGASSNTMTNYSSYTISVVTDDAPDDVLAAIKETFADVSDGGESCDVCSFGGTMLSGATKEWEYNITVSALEDSEGSEISYFVKSVQID